MTEEKLLNKERPGPSTIRRWFLDAFLGLSAVVVIASSIYFLYLPSGYQGGRNLYYDTMVLFSRQTWDLLHAWSGIAMIAIAVAHIMVHWQWFLRMGRRMWQQILGKTGRLNPRGRINLWANFVLTISFILCALSGVYFMFVPGSRQAVDPGILFSPHGLGHDPYLVWYFDDRGSAGAFCDPLEMGNQQCWSLTADFFGKISPNFGADG